MAKAKTKKYKLRDTLGRQGPVLDPGTGKFMRRKIGANNFRRKKRGETLRDISGKVPVSPHIVKRLRKLLPNA